MNNYYMQSTQVMGNVNYLGQSPCFILGQNYIYYIES